MTRDLGPTTPLREPHPGDEHAVAVRAILKAWQDERREALHAEADRVQRVSLDDLMRDDDHTGKLGPETNPATSTNKA